MLIRFYVYARSSKWMNERKNREAAHFRKSCSSKAQSNFYAQSSTAFDISKNMRCLSTAGLSKENSKI